MAGTPGGIATAAVLLVQIAQSPRPPADVATLPIQSGPVVIDFEDVATAGMGEGGQVVVDNQYASRGITFNRVFVMDYSKGIGISGFAHSGTKAVTQCYGLEFCEEPIAATFTTLQARVKVWVGYSARHEAGTIVLIAKDDAGQNIDRRATALPASDGPTPVAQSMEIALPEARIRSIEIQPQSGLFRSDVAVDDVEFETLVLPSPETPTEVTPPTPTPLLDVQLDNAAFHYGGDGESEIVAFVTVSGMAAPATTLVADSMAWGTVTTDVPSMMPGEHTVRVAVPRTLSPGRYIVSLHINEPAGQAESNQANNTTEFAIEIPAPVRPGIPWWIVLGGLATVGAGGLILRLLTRKPSQLHGVATDVTFKSSSDPGRPRVTVSSAAPASALSVRAHPGQWTARLTTRN